MRREFKEGDILVLEQHIIELIENKDKLPDNGISANYTWFDGLDIYGTFEVKEFNYFSGENECHDIRLTTGKEWKNYDVSWFRLADEMIEAEDF